jgi:lipopolysaccharide transport system ATP-binding protein
MNETVIRVERLGKRYQLGSKREAYGTLRDTIASAVRAPLRMLRDRGLKHTRREFWALRDISLEVKRGEVLGIIGRNGAGKSTLLKILARVTYPSAGRAEIIGRIGSLLEVGTGFHPELTGRENIYLNGAILGMRKAEIQQKFGEIVEFAEMEQFLDTAVKRYSSGMFMRLAFSVAAHLEPEILVVDEVLAVGDAAFQKKCLGKMGSVAKEGRTVLFVSHNMLAIENLCSEAICLDSGRIIEQGRPAQVIGSYLQNNLPIMTERFWPESPQRNETEDVWLHCLRVRPVEGSSTDRITVHTPIAIEFEYWNVDPSARVSVSFSLYNERDVLLFDICPPDWQQDPSPSGLLHTACYLPGDLLNDGLHRIDLILWRNHSPVIREPFALTFNIQDSMEDRGNWYGEWQGAIRPRLKWESNKVLSPKNGPLSL